MRLGFDFEKSAVKPAPFFGALCTNMAFKIVTHYLVICTLTTCEIITKETPRQGIEHRSLALQAVILNTILRRAGLLCIPKPEAN
jgi:hypothetical protein